MRKLRPAEYEQTPPRTTCQCEKPRLEDVTDGHGRTLAVMCRLCTLPKSLVCRECWLQWPPDYLATHVTNSHAKPKREKAAKRQTSLFTQEVLNGRKL